MTHHYGPHRDEDTPHAVTVLGRGKWPQEVERPLPTELAHQRQQINQWAAEPLAPQPQA